MQGLFGRFGKQNPTVTSPPSSQSNIPSTTTDIEFDEFPITSRFNDDEETNWDDVETLVDLDRVPYPQPIVPVSAPTPAPPIDLDEDWADALPAATVKNSNTQEARRSKTERLSPPSGELWSDPSPTAVPMSVNGSYVPQARAESSGPTSTAIGFWSAIVQQLRRMLPPPARQLSDAILTAIVALFLTVTIWFIDGFLATSTPSQVVTPPTAPVATSPLATDLQLNPDRVFVEAIQAQLSEITSQYPDNLVQTLQVDLPRDLAIVRLNPIWYTIDDALQDRLTDRMWLQAQANNFSKLELQDATGHSIGRSPVVGQHMVILQRRQADLP